jgi:DNA-binding NarL/FixJ family response regulator
MLADDHLLLRQVVREIVDREPDLEVVAEAGDGEAAVQQAAEAQPDVVLMDLSMPVCDGFQATQQILACSPHSRVVIFSASAEEQHVLRALQCGAIGYITKDACAEGLLTAIRRAAQSDLYMAHPLATRLLTLLRTLKLETPPKVMTAHAPGILKSAPARKPRSKRHLPLTGRERQVLNLIRQGQRNREIARELRIAESTVHKHVQNIFEKLDARNRAEALFLEKA